MVFGMEKIGKKYTVENFFDFLGGSRDRKSVIEIAQNYRKKRFLRITGEPVITGKKEKISPLQIRLRFRCKKNVCRYLVWFSHNRYPLSGPT
jgi:hypothetical protein